MSAASTRSGRSASRHRRTRSTCPRTGAPPRSRHCEPQLDVLRARWVQLPGRAARLGGDRRRHEPLRLGDQRNHRHDHGTRRCEARPLSDQGRWHQLGTDAVRRHHHRCCRRPARGRAADRRRRHGHQRRPAVERHPDARGPGQLAGRDGPIGSDHGLPGPAQRRRRRILDDRLDLREHPHGRLPVARRRGQPRVPRPRAGRRRRLERVGRQIPSIGSRRSATAPRC